ncbi:naringenin-chalcone synthase [Aliidongia dinghuensis]|uniref:Naringenin-chalcone synthase n=1 Tax=Aliidongia dinghuensis TaxID=1867774 RepID=A0A8J2YY90_9PROT|nr:type III polyketide synthase [Aliidongia dinghuensis]GGF39323.1 naringenin-chalcone synthase [Aliidongia dinghuensis]
MVTSTQGRAYLNHVASAVPPNEVHGAFVRFADTLLADPRHAKLFRRMVDRAEIHRRYSVLAPAEDPSGPSVDAQGFFHRGAFPSTSVRMQRYQAEALPLALRTVDRLGLGPEVARASHLIVTSCTGLYAPGLDLELAAALGIPPAVERTMVGFMGCYAAFNALKLARHIVRSDAEARVLIVNLELCTLHLQETSDLEQILSFLVFADGCAAAWVTAEPKGLTLDRFRTVLVPESADLITWNVGDQGFDMRLSGQVPGAISHGLKPVAAEILDGAAVSDIDLWAVHPGGRSVLDAVQGAFDLPAEALGASRRVLADFGNMSSATIMFVLERLMAAAEPGQRGAAMSFGPGLTAETMLFHAA